MSVPKIYDYRLFLNSSDSNVASHNNTQFTIPQPFDLPADPYKITLTVERWHLASIANDSTQTFMLGLDGCPQRNSWCSLFADGPSNSMPASDIIAVLANPQAPGAYHLSNQPTELELAADPLRMHMWRLKVWTFDNTGKRVLAVDGSNSDTLDWIAQIKLSYHCRRQKTCACDGS